MTNQVRTWESDDRDFKVTTELYVFRGGNGDFYIGSRRTGEQSLLNGVRICLSGGTSAVNPKITKAIADLYAALKDLPEAEDKCDHCVGVAYETVLVNQSVAISYGTHNIRIKNERCSKCFKEIDWDKIKEEAGESAKQIPRTLLSMREDG